MYTIGTAGHVDHGKSALVQALTGVDPDRWREEKERGLTIDLGFAQLTLAGGEKVSIVDVPGHERFIKNMLAGVGGIDLALLVIAADEGVMPQTREHLAILDLLGVARGIVVLTKSDLADADALALARAEATEVITGTILEGSPVIACSAVRRDGLDELLATLESQLATATPRSDIGRPRLPIDRAFTMAGFGTVVTGTLIDGTLEVGTEVEVLTSGMRARVRGLQNHGEKVEVALPGRRTAVNLSGLAVEDLRRGMVLARPGMVRATAAMDVRLRAVRHVNRPVRHGIEVTFHTGSAEVGGRLLLLDAEALGPGEAGWAQVRLDEPVVALHGDRFIVRDPNDTLGGGVIVDVDARRHRRFHGATITELESMVGGTAADRVLLTIARFEPLDVAAVVKASGLRDTDVLSGVAALIEDGRAVRLGAGESALVWSRDGLLGVHRRIEDTLRQYHAKMPLRPGMPREELRSRIGLSARVFEGVVDWLADTKAVREVGAAVALPSYRPELSPADRGIAEAYLKALKASPYSPPTDGKPAPDLLAYLVDQGLVVNVGDGVVFAAPAYEAMVARVTDHLQANHAVTLAQVRDMFQTSRRYAQALLEYLDAQHVTRRVGDVRCLFDAPG